MNAEYKSQVVRVRDFLRMTSADMREAIAEISLLPDTPANAGVHKIACEIESSIRELEARAIAANRAAFEDQT
jgi:hypothetical protein